MFRNNFIFAVTGVWGEWRAGDLAPWGYVVRKAGCAALSRPTVWNKEGMTQVSDRQEARGRGRSLGQCAGCFSDSCGHGFTVAKGPQGASNDGTGGTLSWGGNHKGGSRV
jgi:hypothetical protein